MQRRGAGFLLAALTLLVASLGVDVPSPAAAPNGQPDLVLTAVRLPRPATGKQQATPSPAGAAARTAPKPTLPKRCRSGLVALTFDDGPSRSVTPGLVAMLTARKVPATFFMVGSRIHSAPGAAKLVQRSGFTIGNHTWSHAELPALSDGGIRRQLRSTRREMREHGLAPSDLMRPPYGAITRRVRHDVRALGMVPVLWTIDSRDWTGGTPRQIADRILGALRKRGTNIVLQHDGVTNSPNSVAAVPRVVREARRRGYCFTDLGPRGRPRVPGAAASGGTTGTTVAPTTANRFGSGGPLSVVPTARARRP